MRYTPAILKLMEEYEKSSHGMRLGQYFMCFYLKNTNWPALFYTESTSAAIGIIGDWLDRHQYHDELPLKVSEEDGNN